MSTSATVRVERDGPVTDRHPVPTRCPQRGGRPPPRPGWPTPFGPLTPTTTAGGGAVGRGRRVLRRRRPEGHEHPGPTGSSTTATARWARPACGCRSRSSRPSRASRRRRVRAGVVVRPARGRGGRRVRGVLPAVGGPADRRRHGTAAPPDRDQPGHGPDPHRTAGASPARPSAWVWPTGSSRPGRPAPRRRSWPPSSRPFPQTCMRQDRLSVLEQEGLGEEDALRRSWGTAGCRWPARRWPTGWPISESGAGRHGAGVQDCRATHPGSGP